eukprot:64860_1
MDQELSNGTFIVNLINTCIGFGILSMPYAFAISGYYAILSMLMAFILVFYAGYCVAKVTVYSYNLHQTNRPIDFKVINNTCNGEDESTSETDNPTELINMSKSPKTQNRSSEYWSEVALEVINNTCINNHQEELTTPLSSKHKIYTNKINSKGKSVYANIAYNSFGTFGVIYATFGMICIFTIALINIFVMNWKLLNGIIVIYVQNFNQDLMYLFIIIITIPLIFILNWKSLTFVSWIGICSVTVLTIIIIYLFIKTQMDFKDNNGIIPETYFEHLYQLNTSQYAQNNMNTITVTFFSFLTFVSGLAANGVVPMMVTSVKNNSLRNIKKLLCIAYFIVAIYYSFVGIIGERIYRNSTHVLILTNLFYWPVNHVIPVIISIIMIINLLASWGVLCSIDADMLRGILNIKTHESGKRIGINLFILLITSTIGFFVRDNLSLLIAIYGCVNAICGPALILPFAFYLGMFWNKISFVNKILHILLLLSVVCIAIFVAIQAITSLT